MSELISKNVIMMDLEVNNKDEVMCTLARSIEKDERLNGYNGFLKAVYDREATFPTSIGYGFAIPHGKSDYVKKSTIAFARLKNEICWSEDEMVRYVFMIAVPEKEAGDTHLKVLSQLSRSIMREEFRLSLKEAKTVDEIMRVLTF
ncbi:MAG: PTS sugar transporter [Firmicutes bacterium HGW-Firmicutes-7]|nr:MAG: PTS sugar transporter [Firmicutes bacterium HGW-Firmicutes-7]